MDIPGIIQAGSGIGGIVASIISGLVYRNQKLTDQRYQAQQEKIDAHDKKLEDQNARIAAMYAKFGECKVECTDRFASNEAFVREAGFTRRTMGEVTTSLSRIEGKLEISDRLPEIMGSIASNIVNQLNTRETPK